MAFGEVRISYECSELIEELKEDIKEFGKDLRINAWCMDRAGTRIYTNYDFIDKSDPVKAEEFRRGEYIRQMTAGELLDLLEEQNKII